MLLDELLHAFAGEVRSVPVTTGQPAQRQPPPSRSGWTGNRPDPRLSTFSSRARLAGRLNQSTIEAAMLRADPFDLLQCVRAGVSQCIQVWEDAVEESAAITSPTPRMPRAAISRLSGWAAEARMAWSRFSAFFSANPSSASMSAPSGGSTNPPHRAPARLQPVVPQSECPAR